MKNVHVCYMLVFDCVPIYVGSGAIGRPDRHFNSSKLNDPDNTTNPNLYRFIRSNRSSIEIEIIETGGKLRCVELEEFLTAEIGRIVDGSGPLLNIKIGSWWGGAKSSTKWSDGTRSKYQELHKSKRFDIDRDELYKLRIDDNMSHDDIGSMYGVSGALIKKLCSRHNITKTKEQAYQSRTGIVCTKVVCPHCGKVGGGNSMFRFHFNNCIGRRDG